jgi:Nitrogenase molybdenum-iron protein, alpha and beta chains
MEKRHGERREGGHQERGHKRGHHGGGYSVLAKPEGTQLLFIGSRSCSRHKGVEKQQLQKEGKLSFLCLDEIDWISGGYLDLITQAAKEIIEERKPEHLVLLGGCQVELLSTDYQALTQSLSEKYGMDVHFHKGCHLIGYDRNAEE